MTLLLLTLFSSFLFANYDMAFMQETSDGVKKIHIKSRQSCISQALPTGFDFNIYPAITRDANEIAYIAGEGPESLSVYIMNLQNFSVQKITKEEGFFLHPHFSASSRFLTFSQMRDGKNQIVVYDRIANKVKDRVSNESPLFFPKLSSNASFIVYQKSLSQDKKEIWLNYFDKRDSIRLAQDYKKCMAPSLSFDDTKVLFTCFENKEWNIYLQDLETLKIKQITDSQENSFAPSFDKDNNIIFASNPEGYYAIYKIKRLAESDQYQKQAELLYHMDGDLYAPSISGNLNYKQSFSKDLPKPARSSFGAAHFDGRIYVIGGHKGAEHTYPPESFSDQVDIFDISKNKWLKGSPRPAKAHGYDLEVCNNKIYAFGGFAYSKKHKPKWKSLDRVDRYDPESDSWKQVASMPRARSSNVAAKVNGKVYLIGGWDSTPQHEDDYEGTFHREIDVFDCKTETFVESDLEIPDPLRRAFTGVVKDEKIYLIGGLGQGATHFELLNHVTVFDPKTNTFTEETPLPFGTFAPASGFINDRLHVFGGMFQTGEMAYEYVNHIYANTVDGWQHTGRYLSESKGFSMVVNVGNEAWVLGGHSYDGNTDEPVNTVEVWSAH